MFGCGNHAILLTAWMAFHPSFNGKTVVSVELF